MNKLAKTIALGALVIAAIQLKAAESDSVLIRNVTVHPVTSPPVEHAAVLVVNGRVAEVGANVHSRSGARVIDGHNLHLYPGLINAGSNVGLSEISAIRDTVDLDEMGMFNPELRAEVAFNPSSEHIEVTRAAGITSVVSLPGTGAVRRRNAAPSIIAGQGALMHLAGWTWETMAVKPSALMEMNFPQTQATSGHGDEQTFDNQQKENRQFLEQTSRFLEDVRRYQRAKSAHATDFQPDIKLEAMLPVIEGKQPLLVRAQKEKAIKEAVAFADKEKVKIIIADPLELGSTGPLLKSHNIPVILGKTLALPEHDDDPYDAPYTLPNEFYKAGVKICFGTFDVEFARNVPFEAAQAVAFGLPAEEALKALTINTADILGVSAEVGSIEKGKLADLILTDGDPLQSKTSIKQMFIAGKPVSLESRHTREYEKWMNRP
jgi:imidazolonepropionase-like amidohydrolase